MPSSGTVDHGRDLQGWQFAEGCLYFKFIRKESEKKNKAGSKSPGGLLLKAKGQTAKGEYVAEEVPGISGTRPSGR